jgi:hypothetical protein
VTNSQNPYQNDTFVLAAGEVRMVIGALSSFAILSATFQNDVAISCTDGSGTFYNVPFGVTLEFPAPVFLWIKNTNAAQNTVAVGSGSAKIYQTIVGGGAVSITGTAAVSVADSADVAQGGKNDAAATTDSGNFSLIALIKRLLGKFPALAKSVFTLNSAATTNANNIKASAGRVYSVDAINTTGASKFLRLYDKASAPTVGTDVSYRTVLIPASSSVHLEWAAGDAYANGIGLAITNLIAYNDATAIAANDVQVSVKYE